MRRFFFDASGILRMGGHGASNYPDYQATQHISHVAEYRTLARGGVETNARAKVRKIRV
jgi:hypothetical protein